MGTEELAPARVVVAEDDDDVREGLCAILERGGFAIVGRATNGAEAVTVALGSCPDVVLTDLRMPGIDGIEAARRIKAAFPSTQVIVLSAYDDESLHRLADDAGVYCYLVKGCPPSLIGDMVRRACDFKHQIEDRATRP